jgi:hypothetical protein
MVNVHINSLIKTFALNLLVHSHAYSILGNITDSSIFAMVTHVGPSFLKSIYSLDVYNTTLLVESHVHDQRNSFMFSKRPREHVWGASSPSLVFVILVNSWKIVVLAKRICKLFQMHVLNRENDMSMSSSLAVI